MRRERVYPDAITASAPPPTPRDAEPVGTPRREGAGEFELLAEVVDLAILRADGDGRVTYANSAACELLWRTPEGLAGHGWLEAIHQDDRRRVAAAAAAVLGSGTASVEECRIDVLGELRWSRLRLNAIRTGRDEPTGWVAIGEDITAERAASDELTRRATHDALTGLPNRVLLEDRLSLALARSHRDRSSVTVLFLDLDRFKQVNDRHGHRTGDRLLREVATRITRAIRGSDTAARLGGDEFVVVAEGLDREVAVRVALRITDAIAQPVDLGSETMVLRASVGVAQSPHAAVAPAVLIDAADAAMYEAKRLQLGLAFSPLGDGSAADHPA